jgi:hypothetical protein
MSGRVTFGVAPASAGGPDGRSNFSFAVTPGAVLFDHVAALNYSATPLTLQLYATDAVETSSGGFGLLPSGAKPTGVGSWISIPTADATVHVPAQTATGPGLVVVPITVHIPDKVEPGDHAGGVVVSLSTTETNASGQNVILQQRIGTRVFIRVSGTVVPKLAVTDVHSSYHGTLNPIGEGKVLVSYRVSNVGNVDLALDQSVKVSGLFGSKRAVRLGHVALLLPGTSLSERAVVPKVRPEFIVHETVTAHPSSPAGSSESGLEPATATSTVWAIPWTLLGLIVLFLLAVVAFFRARARRARRSRRGRHTAAKS